MKRVRVAAFGLICLLLYGLTNYGGTRSPDGDVVFRSAEALATDGSFALKSELESWQGFGMVRGKDGNLYSIFGPGQAIVAVPFVLLAHSLNRGDWFRNVNLPISHYAGFGVKVVLDETRPADMRPHADRFVVSWLGPLAGALGATTFLLIVSLFVRRATSALFCASLFAFGTLHWPYTGTFFSETLAMLFLLTGFYFLIKDLFAATADDAGKSEEPDIRLNSEEPRRNHEEPRRNGEEPGMRRNIVAMLNQFLAGAFVGLAGATHVTAFLAAPFFVGFLAYRKVRGDASAAPVLSHLAGLMLLLFLLGLHNYLRFDNFFETGRLADPKAALIFGYGSFVFPWTGLFGLIVSSGKSLFLFCPAVVWGLWTWKSFHEKHPALSYALAAMLLFRALFIASRSDWHAGFSLGPRYLLMAAPFLLLPVAVRLDEYIERENVKKILLYFVLFWLCAIQQIFFSLGEVFSFYHRTRINFHQHGNNIFAGHQIYFDWNISPLLHLLEYERGPYFLRMLEASNVSLWLVLVLIAGATTAIWAALVVRKSADPLSSNR